MIKFSVRSNISTGLALKIANKTDIAGRITAEQVRKDTSQYVPMLTGSLDDRTMVKGTSIIYPGPYARYLYYGKVMVDPDTGSPYAKRGATKVLTDRNLVFTKDFHGQAQAFWFEASKAQNKDKWLQVMRRAVDRYGG